MLDNDFEIIENQTIYFKSSEKMSEISDNSIDVIITSPPYNRGKDYFNDNKEYYDDKKDIQEYLIFLRKVWRECLRVLRYEGIFFLNIGDSASDQGKSELVAKSAEEVGFIRIQNIIWVKSILGRGHYTPSGGNKRLNNVWENIYMFCKDKNKYQIFPKNIGIPYSDKSNIGRYSEDDLRDPGNIWLIPYSETTGLTIKKGHSAPFPIELPLYCIKLTRARLVLDPFAGIGTTLAAAKYLKIKSIGYEKYPLKSSIEKRIRIPYQEPQKENLIPHLELTIDVLSEIINFFDSRNKLYETYMNNTKKQKNRLEIANSVLKNLNVDDFFIEKILSLYKEEGFNKNKENNRKKNLKNIFSLNKYLKEEDH